MSTFSLSMPAAQRRLTLNDAPPQVALTEQYRPKTLAAMVGQGAAVNQLQGFLDAPHSAAMLFVGPTGVGKTTAAKAIAAELGAVEYGGLEEIKSGMQDAEAVARVLDGLRFTPMLGSGWKVIIVDEADYMSQKAAQMWLSALEDLPPFSVVIFTTNHLEKMASRFIDRCERIDFVARGDEHLQDAQALVDEIWSVELPRDVPPTAAELPGLYDNDGQISYRRVVRALEPLLRQKRPRPAPMPTPRPSAPVLPAPPRPSPQESPTMPRDASAERPATVAPRDPGRLPGDRDGDAVTPCTSCRTRFGGRARNGTIQRTAGRCQRCHAAAEAARPRATLIRG